MKVMLSIRYLGRLKEIKIIYLAQFGTWLGNDNWLEGVQIECMSTGYLWTEYIGIFNFSPNKEKSEYKMGGINFM